MQFNPLKKFERPVVFFSVSNAREYSGPTETIIDDVLGYITQNEPGIMPDVGPKVATSHAVVGLRIQSWQDVSSVKVGDYFATDDGVRFFITRILTNRPGPYPVKIVGEKRSK